MITETGKSRDHLSAGWGRGELAEQLQSGPEGLRVWSVDAISPSLRAGED